tara:strand:+ start:120 stop:803 length:684 start_codon:yes stop_codon:yes gene_type:complete
MREIVLDIETTGLDYNSGHKIIDIACVEISNFVPTGKVFQTYVNPERESSSGAKEQHGISDEFLKNKKLFKEIVPEFLKFIENSPLIAHNGSFFDIPFLNHELKNNNIDTINNKIIDTLILARKKFPGSPVNLDALCRRFDIDLGVRNKHSALVDAKLLSKVYLELKGGQQPNLILETKKKIEKIDEVKTFEKKKLKERKFLLSEEEEKEHKNFIKKIKNPLWSQYN